jgi:hypothetical protein
VLFGSTSRIGGWRGREEGGKVERWAGDCGVDGNVGVEEGEAVRVRLVCCED